MSTVASFPARIVFVNKDGTLTSDAVRWFQRQVVPRIGGPDSLTNDELAALVSDLSADLIDLTTQVAALDAELTATEESIEAVIVGEQVFQPAAAQVLGEMTFQE